MNQEPFTPKDNWPIKNRIHGRAPIPFGYVVNPDNDLEAIPHWDTIKIIEAGLDYIDNGSSYREVASWLSTELNDTVSHQAVANWWRDKRKSIPGNERAKALRKQARKNSPKTNKEKAERAARHKLAGAKRSVIARTKRVEGFIDPEPKLEVPFTEIPTEDFDEIEYVDPRTGKEVIFEPNAGPQTDFLAASEQEVLYGGAAGGGKSYALLADPLIA